MINKGKQFETDIKNLKALAAARKKNSGKYGADYISFRDNIAGKYDVSVRTVQNWVKAKTPWARDKRDDAGKIRSKVSPKVTGLIDDALKSGHTKKQVKKIITDKTGKNISNRVLNREAKKEVTSDHTGYGSEAKEFFKKLFDIDLIPSDKGIKMKYKNSNFIINKSDLADVCMILANAYVRSTGSSTFKINRAAMRRSNLWQMFDEAVTLINDRGVNITDLKEISLFIQRLEIDRNKINPRAVTVWKIVQNYNPSVTLDEVISLAEELEGVYD